MSLLPCSVFSRSANVLSLFEPYQAVKEHWIKGERSAMESGDIHWSFFNRVNYVTALFRSGAELSRVKEECLKAYCVSYISSKV